MKIVINGTLESLPDATTVAALLALRSLTGKRVAIELNGEIVPKSRHADTVLNDADTLEIVIAVGGG